MASQLQGMPGIQMVTFLGAKWNLGNVTENKISKYQIVNVIYLLIDSDDHNEWNHKEDVEGKK